MSTSSTTHDPFAATDAPTVTEPVATVAEPTRAAAPTSTTATADPAAPNSENRERRPLPPGLDPALLEGLSKNARKKLIKDHQWQLRKAERVVHRRDERKAKAEKRRLMREQGLELPPRRGPVVKPEDMVPSGVTLLIDLDFDGKMIDKEAKSMCKQLLYCYAANRRTTRPVNLVCAGMSQELEGIVETQIAEYKNWPNFPFHRESYTSVPTIGRSSLVYLTADSPNVLTHLEPGTTYVIGGIVDHNRHKRLCLDRANKDGVKHAQLPIGEFVALNSRKVLTINQCVEIMINVLQNGNDWKAAFETVIPQRKFKEGARNGSAEPQDGDEGQDDDEEAGEAGAGEESADPSSSVKRLLGDQDVDATDANVERDPKRVKADVEDVAAATAGQSSA
ncbi:tRNA (guanine(9)-N(1))-methyltransferase [Allomyces arbusculus]|nr:tRNA (guanine(9)-N(1))-methyltransferase [Allomyces arbusculus]